MVGVSQTDEELQSQYRMFLIMHKQPAFPMGVYYLSTYVGRYY